MHLSSMSHHLLELRHLLNIRGVITVFTKTFTTTFPAQIRAFIPFDPAVDSWVNLAFCSIVFAFDIFCPVLYVTELIFLYMFLIFYF